ncbi:MAG: NPCBM/NEW2 domain-containing protein [Planctomycetota bacterium]
MLLAAPLAFAATARAQDGLMGTAHTIDGRTLVGVLAVDERGQAVARGGEFGELKLDLGEITAFERAGGAVTPVTPDHRVWLRSGLELPAVRIGGKAAADGKQALVVIELPSGIAVEVPLASVRAIRHGGTARPEPALFAADLQKPSGSEDLIYVLKDGKAQRSAVTVTGLTGDRVAFLLRGSPYDFELSGLAGVVFGATTGFAPDRQPKPRTSLQLTTGERLEGRLLTLDKPGATFRLDEGCVLTIPAERLARLQVASDRLLWLSELAPKVVEQTPAFDRIWPWSIDRTPVGPGFVLGGKKFERGLCLVPKTRLVFDLGGRYDLFEATIGIDDRTGPEAHAVFRVLVDDQVAFTSAAKVRGAAPEVLRLELKKAKSLTLEVDFGKNYDLGDYCVFADARLVQQ